MALVGKLCRLVLSRVSVPAGFLIGFVLRPGVGCKKQND